uniref:TFIIS central domain-containing protein n=2 Tax=Physcomitrium patens TaxID=3218 RepID=A0A2K1K491_PHYPA|nr:uncharacterized protein LOC112286435 [Physcomitrium patens]PNR48595.1 hypothetical protein PHYPA_013072 [Physcomitrium patens]|eukprot:XP_024384085.1 uncharacterized protein LOC112286435 [Physcomitrella patens]
MSLLAMDTSSLFDPFEFPPEIDLVPPKPEPRFREKLEIKTPRHQDHHLKAMMVAREFECKSREFLDMKPRLHDVQPKMQMIETPSSTTAPAPSDLQSARQKLRDALTSALEMVVSKQLVKSVLGVGVDAQVESGDEQKLSTLEGYQLASLSQEIGSPAKSGQVVDSLVVDLGPLETESTSIDSIEVSASEFVTSGGDYKLNFDHVSFGYGEDLEESPLKKLKTDFGQFEFGHRKLEIEEKEGRVAVEDVKGGLHIMDQARKLATDIEAELFKLYGSKKTYNQKARSLLFNLKDKSNPELRARVFSGEIPPADLCRMSGEQLASKELSDWRNAKEQALDKMLVLTDAGKVVKKTHKGEFVVDVENESTVDIIPTFTRSVFPVSKVEEKAEQDVSAQTEGHVQHSQNKSKYGMSPSLKRNRSEEIDRVAVDEKHTLDEKNVSDMAQRVLVATETVLPTILSLDEYMEAQDGEGVQEDVFEDAPIEPRDISKPNRVAELAEEMGVRDSIDPSSANPEVTEDRSPALKIVRTQDVSPRMKSMSIRDGSPGRKSSEAAEGLVKEQSDTVKNDEATMAWTGQIQLSSSRQSPLAIKHRSGEKVDLKSWPKSLELKGRVRLAHLDKFLQELQQSRSRAVTVTSVIVQDGHSDQAGATDHVQEIASQYQMGDRVGFIEPRSGYELYLLPPGSGTTKLLSDHGHSSTEALGKDVVLVGVIVWRRSHLSSSSRPADRNNIVKRHAVASSTHDSVSKSSRAGVDTSKEPSSDPRTKSRGGINVSSALSSMHVPKFPVDSPTKEDPSPSRVRNWPPSTNTTSNTNVLKSRHITPTPADATTDLPPGFSVRQTPLPERSVFIASRPHLDPRLPAHKKDPRPSQSPVDVPSGFWPRPPQNMLARRPISEDDDDDLPEFDFSVHTVGANNPPSPRQFSGPGTSLNSESPHLSHFPPRQSPAIVSDQSALPLNAECFSGYPSRPNGPLPPPQDPASFLPRNSSYYSAVGTGAAPLSGDGHLEVDLRPSPHELLRVAPGPGSRGQQAMLGQPGPLPQPSVQHYGAPIQGVHGAPLATPIPRNDLSEWHPSTQFQKRPSALFENDPRHVVAGPAARQPPHFDTATLGGAPPPPLAQPQDLSWPPPQQHHQQAHQQAPPTLLPPPPMPLPQYLQQPEQSRGYFQPQPQPQWQQQHSNHFQLQPQHQPQHMAVRPTDPRGAPFINSWESHAPPWDAAGARSSNSNVSTENPRDDRSSGEHRMKDSRSTDQLSWHERERDSNGARPDYRRR